jgi:hypothetical protein
LSKETKEIELTKELAKQIKKRFPNFKLYANKCPSRSHKVRKLWKSSFREPCPPLQPEMDIIMYEPQDDTNSNNEKVRAIEIKYYRKKNGKVKQSFYKGIEQSLALLQWGFDNVALWQLFDPSFSDEELWSYGARTWIYIHTRLNLPIEYTMFRVTKKNPSFAFEILNPNWYNYPEIKNLGRIETYPPFSYAHPNPFISGKMKNDPLGEKSYNEAMFLRKVIIDWLKVQKDMDRL